MIDYAGIERHLRAMAKALDDAGVRVPIPELRQAATELTAAIDSAAGGGPHPVRLANLRVDTVTETTANVLWDGDLDHQGVIEYGVTGGAFDHSLLDPDWGVTGHWMTLHGLTPATPYQVRIRAKDRSGQTTVSDAIHFTTAGPPPPPPATSDPAARDASGALVAVIDLDREFDWLRARFHGDWPDSAVAYTANTTYAWGDVWAQGSIPDDLFAQRDAMAAAIEAHVNAMRPHLAPGTVAVVNDGADRLGRRLSGAIVRQLDNAIPTGDTVPD